MYRFLRTGVFVLVLLLVTSINLPLDSADAIASEIRLKVITVKDDGETTRYKSGAKRVSDFFEEQGIKLYDGDLCDYALTKVTFNNMTIHITRGFYITAFIDDEAERIKISPYITASQLMEQLQDELDVALILNGEVNSDELLTENSELSFSTWRSEFITSIEEIPFEIITEETTSLSNGTEKVRQEGEPGERKITAAVIYIGDEEHNREIIEEEILREPVNRIIDRGIGGALGTTADTSAESFRYREKLTMNASAYTAGYESTGKNPGDKGYGITYTGARVQKGIVSVDPKVVPLGTKLYVEGYGYSLAADTGSGIVGNMIDLFYESLSDALKFGRRNLTVYILD